MRCVILAAGEGIRMRPLTLERPKPLLEICGKPLIEHIIDRLPKEIDELIVVVGYKGEQIRDFLGEEFNGRKVEYIWQKEKLGTGHALKLCSDILAGERFMMLYADDIYGSEDLKRLAGHDLALATYEVENPERFGVVSVDSNMRVLEIEEKPERPKSNLVSAGAMMLDKRIFDYEPSRHVNGEYYLTTMVNKLIKKYIFLAEPVSFWISTAGPEDLKRAEILLKNQKSNV